jgi:hypothetical protein
MPSDVIAAQHDQQYLGRVNRNLSPNQFSDWIGPEGSFGEPTAVGGTFTGSQLGTFPGATPGTY